MHGEQIAASHIRKSGHEAVEGVEGVAGKGGGDDELVVSFVHVSVHDGQVGEAVPPVHFSVRNHHY